MPLPSMLRPSAPSTRWKRSNSLGSSDLAMPMPLSSMRTSAAPPPGAVVTLRAILPRRVNLKAL